eukprot:TRINITY_DN3295_c3_g6_i4.p1 TRINITY_DN3295_c3_g6~~TRINITY_DN3295_c3_g6_i4.p1  ORF type:complete len:464 (-),score=187.72 TRINITY_DN3295_c3_g6_i4:71-1462(-)
MSNKNHNNNNEKPNGKRKSKQTPKNEKEYEENSHLIENEHTKEEENSLNKIDSESKENDNNEMNEKLSYIFEVHTMIEEIVDDLGKFIEENENDLVYLTFNSLKNKFEETDFSDENFLEENLSKITTIYESLKEIHENLCSENIEDADEEEYVNEEKELEANVDNIVYERDSVNLDESNVQEPETEPKLKTEERNIDSTDARSDVNDETAKHEEEEVEDSDHSNSVSAKDTNEEHMEINVEEEEQEMQVEELEEEKDDNDDFANGHHDDKEKHEVQDLEEDDDDDDDDDEDRDKTDEADEEREEEEDRENSYSSDSNIEDLSKGNIENDDEQADGTYTWERLSKLSYEDLLASVGMEQEAILSRMIQVEKDDIEFGFTPNLEHMIETARNLTIDAISNAKNSLKKKDKPSHANKGNRTKPKVPPSTQKPNKNQQTPVKTKVQNQTIKTNKRRRHAADYAHSKK